MGGIEEGNERGRGGKKREGMNPHCANKLNIHTLIGGWQN